jgi:membrane protein YdbS with pleckstrin-like domain
LPVEPDATPAVPDLPVEPVVPPGPPLPGDDAAARHRLPPRVRTAWRLRALSVGVPLVAVLGFLALRWTWIPEWLRWGALVAAGVWLLVQLLVAPPVRYRLTWWALTADELEVQHGWIVLTRTVVPMHRVQYLQVERGLIDRRMDLADLHVHTAGGPVAVRGLDRQDADAVRARISELAHLDDDR